MTLSEFKAWFEGFTESMDGPPSLKQWERIQARVKEISGAPVTERVFIDRYAHPANPWRYLTGLPHNGLAAMQNVTLNAGACQAAAGVGNLAFETVKIGGTELGANGHMARFDRDPHPPAFDSHSAMNALGKADAASLSA